MSFASLQFILFLAVVFPAYWYRPAQRWQNIVTVIASYYFYAWWDIRFCPLLILSSVVDYWAGRKIEQSGNPRVRRLWLVASLCSNLGLLGFFKYYDFFADSLAIALATIGINVGTTSLGIVLPIGISFYTFQTMSYAIDIYRRKFKPANDFVAYMAFVSFFPQLVAGPIERASHLLPQFLKPRMFSYADAVSGCQLMLWGFFKKMAVADNLAQVVDAAYSSPASVSAVHLGLATVFFAFQIYCDFSGYSDIAAGVARWFGIGLMRNFDHPYFSRDFGEFWRRWHISLSTWFRDYVYIPLGGSRGTVRARVRNVAATFLLSGLWHGASWTFVLWGALHALYLMPRHLGANQPAPSASQGGFGDVMRVARTFFLVCAAWVLFRSDSLSEAVLIYQKIAVQIWSPEAGGHFLLVWRTWPRAFIALGIFLTIEVCTRKVWNPFDCVHWPRPVRWAAYTLLFWSTLYFCPARIAPFIYFQF